MADMVTKQELEAAKIDVKNAGEAVNEEKVVKTRLGRSFKSIPLIVKEGEAKITQAAQTITSATASIVAQKNQASAAISQAESDVVTAATDVHQRGNQEIANLQNAIDIAAAAGAGENGWTAQLIVDGDKTQKQINSDQRVRNLESPTFKDYGAVGTGSLVPVSDLYTMGTLVFNPKIKNLADVKVIYPDVTTATDSLDWAAIQKAVKDRAFKDVQSRGGKFVVNKKIVFNDPVHIIGDFENGTIYYTGDVTDAALSYQPLVKGSRNAYLSQLHVRPFQDQASNTADAFRSVSNSTGGLNHLIIDNCDFRALGGGRAINLMNETGNVNADGTALVYIGRNTLVGGIRAPRLGDSCIIYWNNIKGKNIGIEGSIVNDALGSASSLVIEKNNIINDNGAIKLSGIRNTHILHNNIEQLVALNLADDRHTIELDGDIQSSYNTVMFNKIQPSDPNKYCGGIKLTNITGAAVKFNHIGSSAVLDGSFNPVGRTDCIKLIDCKDVDVGRNKLYISSGCNGVYINPTTTGTSGVNDQSYRFFSEANSTRTIDDCATEYSIWRDITVPEIIPYDENSTNIQAKLINGVVHLRGQVKLASGSLIAAGAILANLPTGMRPKQRTYIPFVSRNTGGGAASSYLTITTAGSVQNTTVINDNLLISICCSFAI